MDSSNAVRRARRDFDPDWIPPVDFPAPSVRDLPLRSRSPSYHQLRETPTPPSSPEREHDLIAPELLCPDFSKPHLSYDWLRHVSDVRYVNGDKQYYAHFEGYPSPLWVSRSDLLPSASAFWERLGRLARKHEARKKLHPPSPYLKSGNDRLACQICFERERCMMYMPCRHVYSCGYCSREMVKRCTNPVKTPRAVPKPHPKNVSAKRKDDAKYEKNFTICPYCQQPADCVLLCYFP